MITNILHARYRVLVLTCGYFTLLLVPKWVPSVGSTPLFFIYTLSVILLLLILVAVAGRSGSRFAFLSLVWFALIFVVFWSVRGALPTGSYLSRFDPVVWQQRDSAQYVKGDITPRQKMLGDVVENVLPGRSQAEIEKLLGASDDAADGELIYELGPERDSMFSIDDEALVIRLNSSGRFARYHIHVD